MTDDKIALRERRPIEGDWPYLWLDATYVKDPLAIIILYPWR